MQKTLIALLSATTMIGSAHAAEYHECGDYPQQPALFEVESATYDEIKAAAGAFNDHKKDNTVFIDCLKATSQSDAIQGLGKKKRKKAMKALNAELDTITEREQEYAEEFNARYKEWAENRKKESR